MNAKIGTKVTAAESITEDNFQGQAVFEHARRGDRGEVVHVDKAGARSVRWERTGTVTVCDPDEIEVLN